LLTQGVEVPSVLCSPRKETLRQGSPASCARAPGCPQGPCRSPAGLF